MRRRGEGGSAGLLVVWSCLVVMLAAIAALLLGAAVSARHRAGRVADSAALAGARSALQGEAEPCGAALRIVLINGASMRACRASAAGSVLVVVEVPVVPNASGLAAVLDMPPARARARAGVPISERRLAAGRWP